MSIKDKFVAQLSHSVRVMDGSADDLDRLIADAGEARIVLVGEASHGTHEFYKLRAELTRRLICEKGFHGVVAEADWPDAYRVNRYVRGFSDDDDATDALGSFRRFPQWMWRNADVLDFVGWLRDHNDAQSGEREKVGFYGMDLYSLNSSIRAVLEYLDKVDHAAASRARYRYSCFEDFGEDPQAYGYAASFDLSRSCHEQVVAELVELRRQAAEYAKRDGRVAEDEFFYAEQNARLVHNAERYYRGMFEGRVSSWNLRDQHMADTLDALMQHFDRRVGSTKLIVWAHNSHLGDAGELNVGQLMRERHGRACYNIGFSTYEGTVTAASDWDGPAQRKRVRPGLPGSYEALFHEIGLPRFILTTRDATGEAARLLRQPRLQRAIGVIYRPETERISHYFHARLGDQFDAMIHLDQTRAVEPLEREPAHDEQDVPETYPTGV